MINNALSHKFFDLCRAKDSDISNIDNDILYLILEESGFDRKQINQILKSYEQKIFLCLYTFFTSDQIRTIRKTVQTFDSYDRYTLETILNCEMPVIKINETDLAYIRYTVLKRSNHITIYSTLIRYSNIITEYNDFETNMKKMSGELKKDGILKKIRYNNVFKKLYPIKEPLINNLDDNTKKELINIVEYADYENFTLQIFLDVIKNNIDKERKLTYKHLEELNNILVNYRFLD